MMPHQYELAAAKESLSRLYLTAKAIEGNSDQLQRAEAAEANELREAVAMLNPPPSN
jgi:hypothetical protein